jgi:hypothetical protein
MKLHGTGVDSDLVRLGDVSVNIHRPCRVGGLKTAIFQAGDDDYDVINAHYQTYVETMFEVEEALYRYVSNSGIVDIRDLFLAKIIGDEYWYETSA